MADTRDQADTVRDREPGEMDRRIRALDWAATPLGPRDAWSPGLGFSVALILASRFPCALRWGPDRVLIYNDAYAPMLGERHPDVLGTTYAQAPPRSSSDVGILERAVLDGRSQGELIEDLPLPTVQADGRVSTGFYTIRLSPLPDPGVATGVGGVLISLTETTRRVGAETALRASEERYQLALEAASGVGAWDWDIVADKVYADPRFAAFHNVPAERAAQGAPLADYSRTLDPEDYQRLFRSGRTHLKSTGDFLEEYRLIQADGSTRWVQGRGRVERDARGWAIRHRGVMVDITERKRTEAALEITEADLRLAVDAAGLGRWDYNPITGEGFWGRRYREIYGLPGDTVENRLDAFERLVHPGDRPALLNAVRAATDPAGDGTINHEYRILRRNDGALRWVESVGRAFFRDGQCVRFVGFVADVTERRQAADRMLMQEATMAVAADAANVGTWDYDPRDGRLMGSDRGYAMLGMAAGAPVAAEDLFVQIHPDDQSTVRASLLGAMDPAARANIDVEFRAVGRDEPVERWIAAKGRGVFDETGACVRVVGATVDITERKRAELHLRLMVNELNHRVKNSLATIQAIASQSFQGARSLPEAKEAFTARIIALAQAHDLLTQENWEGAALFDVLDKLRAVHGDPDCFELGGPAVRLSPRSALSLSMALHELATNAAKYGALSSPTGRVHIDWRVQDGPGAPRLELTWRESGGPTVAPPARRGFGSRLIERGLAAELSGEARIEFEPTGVVCRIVALIEG